MRRVLVIVLAVAVLVVGCGLVGGLVVKQAIDDVTVALGGVAARVEAGPSAAGGLLGLVAQSAGSEIVVRADVVVKNEGWLEPTLRSARFSVTIDGTRVGEGGTKPGVATPIASHGPTIVATETRAPLVAVLAAGAASLGRPTVKIDIAGSAELSVFGFSFTRPFAGRIDGPLVDAAKATLRPVR